MTNGQFEIGQSGRITDFEESEPIIRLEPEPEASVVLWTNMYRAQEAKSRGDEDEVKEHMRNSAQHYFVLSSSTDSPAWVGQVLRYDEACREHGLPHPSSFQEQEQDSYQTLLEKGYSSGEAIDRVADE